MKRTTLYENHLKLKAKMVDFAGWEMPLQYSGIKTETLAVRNAQGVFDVSHMGEIFVSGKKAADFLDYLLSRKISHKNPALTNYAFLCYEDGGVVDDLMVYQLNPEQFMLVVNAANTDKDFDYIKQILSDYPENQDVKVEDLSDIYGLLAIQGNGSLEPVQAALEKVFPELNFSTELQDLKRFRQMHIPLDEANLIISRSGYTGEDGYEVYLPQKYVSSLWENLIDLNITPCGLGARDALRLEAGLPLYGHELSDKINPVEAGLDKFVDFDREFLGAKMIGTMRYHIIALTATDHSIPRDHYKVYYHGKEIGEITSGSFSPTLNKGIAFALVSTELPEDAEQVQVEIRRKQANFLITKTPFI